MTDWRCPDCSWVNRDFADVCLSCGQDRPLGAETVAAAPLPEPSTWDVPAPAPTSMPGQTASMTMQFAPMPTQMAPNPATQAGATIVRPAEPFGFAGLPLGILGAVVAAILASAIWYAVVAFTQFQIGYVAVAVGWLVGTGAVLGARGRGSMWLAGVSIVVTVLALGVSEYLIAYHWTTADLGVSFSLLQPPDVVLDVILAVLQDDPLTLVFWAFAVGAAAVIPLRAMAPVPSSQSPIRDFSAGT
jgi:hypothetical protein